MVVYAMRCPELVKAIVSRKFWTLSTYFSGYELDIDKGIIFGVGEYGNPRYALEDFKFNEYSEWKKIMVEFGVSMSKVSVKAIGWTPKFEEVTA